MDTPRDPVQGVPGDDPKLVSGDEPVEAPTPDTVDSSAEPRQAPDAPQTGDPAVDAVIADLSRVRDRPLAEHIEAGENAHRVLQSRLSDLGGE